MPSQPTLRPDNRLFVALDLPDGLRDLLAAVGAQVARDAGGRAVPAENMHLTVAFLGTVPVAAGPQLCERLVEALAGPAPRL